MEIQLVKLFKLRLQMKLKTFRLIKAIPTSINLAVAAQIQDAKTENIHEGNDILKFDLHVPSY